MKNYTYLVAALLSFGAVQSQDIQDALRYAQQDLNGTARFRAMGGAFGALGGDLSSLNINPAGSAVFANNQIGITLTSYNISNDSDYFGTNTSDYDHSFDLNQAGGVYVMEDMDPEADWKKLTLALNYDNVRNFDNTIFSAGFNPSNSIANYFLSYANSNGGVDFGVIQSPNFESLNYAAWQTLFGYEGFAINAPTAENPLYTSNVPGGGSYYQQNSMVATGFNGKLAFNIATQYQDWLYLGLNLNSHFTDYLEYSSFYEENNNNPDVGLQHIHFDNSQYTFGSGFSFQVGGIAKLKDFRVGVAYESPTWYRMENEMSQSVSFSAINDEGTQAVNDFYDPQITVVHTYKLQTPGKWTGSVAYVFGKSGLISIDYSLKDYSNTSIKQRTDFMGVNYNINGQMSDMLDVASEIRIGAEKKIKQWSLRAGYRMDQSPYKNGRTIGDLNAISAGLGYNFGETKLDLSYTYSQRDTEEAFFSQGLTDAPEIKSINNNISVTLLFEL